MGAAREPRRYHGVNRPCGGGVRQDVGTNVDCFASTTADGRYKLTVTVEDTSVYSDEQSLEIVKGNPTFRTFSLTNSAVLRDGQSMQFTSATDKVSGVTGKIDVRLNVVK
jgi:hypothetical protein